MANRALGSKEITNLVSISNQRAAVIDSRVKWPGRENIRLLAQAVKDRLPFVMFKDTRSGNTNNGASGRRRFKIRYTKHFGGSVYVSPDDNTFTPCGYFGIDKLVRTLDSIEGLEDYVE